MISGRTAPLCRWSSESGRTCARARAVLRDTGSSPEVRSGLFSSLKARSRYRCAATLTSVGYACGSGAAPRTRHARPTSVRFRSHRPSTTAPPPAHRCSRAQAIEACTRRTPIECPVPTKQRSATRRCACSAWQGMTSTWLSPPTGVVQWQRSSGWPVAKTVPVPRKVAEQRYVLPEMISSAP